MIKINKKTVSFLLITFFLNFSLKANEACWIVSGSEQDQSLAFHKIWDALDCKEKTKINGVECRCFQCWKGCSESIENAINKSGNDLTKVTIFQGAHGSPGGGAYCNKAHNNSDEILDLIEKISVKAKVGLLAHSCFSGDLISKKLIRESKNKSSPSIKNSCLLTASTMGKVEYENDNNPVSLALRQTSEVSLHDLFKNSFNQGGLISSAQWSSIYLDQYLSNLETLPLVNAVNASDKLSEFALPTHILSCLNDQVLNPMFTSPNQKILHDWSKEGVDVSDEVIRDITTLTINLNRKVYYIFDDGSIVDRKRSKVENQFLIKCRQHFEAFHGKDMQSFCSDLEIKNEEFKIWSSNNLKKKINNPIEYCLEELYSDKEKKTFSPYWNWKDNISLCPEIKNGLKHLESSLNKDEFLKVLADDKMKSEEKALKILKLYKSINRKNETQSLCGDNILKQIIGKNLDISEESGSMGNRLSHATLAHLLESWVRHNLEHPVLPEDPLDLLRKKACEEFKIKVTKE